MGVLERVDHQVRCLLHYRHLIGRSRLAHLRIDEPYISGEHAMLRWDAAVWELQDMGSRNGTSVNGRRLDAGERAPLYTGDVIELGGSVECWTLIDDSPPSLVAVTEDTNIQIVAEDGLLALPDPDDPKTVIFQDRQGHWVMEREDSRELLVDGQRVSVGDQHFILHVPEVLAPTSTAGTHKPNIDNITLHFLVSRDQEYIELVAVNGPKQIDLGARSHHHLLLALARTRASDGALPAKEQGWLYQDQLAAQLGMNESNINVHVFRCRQQFGAVGIDGAAHIVERRKQTRQLRLGTSHVVIEAM